MNCFARITIRKFLCLGMVSLWTGSVAVHAGEAHVHGAATMQVAVDGNKLTLALSSPLDNLVGFEHAPRTEKQKAAARNMLAQLRKADGAFTPTPAARCVLSSMEVDAPVLDAALASKQAKHAHHDKDDGHGELSAEYVFTCEQPNSLRDVDVKLFDSFKKLHRLDVQIVGPKGQAGAKLSPAKRLVSW